MEKLRKNVRFIRKQRGYTLEQFGRIVGLTMHTVSSFESGSTGVSITVLKKIRDLFNISADDLLFKDLTKEKGEIK